MRVENPSILCRWFQRVFPTVALREAGAPGECNSTICQINRAGEAPPENRPTLKLVPAPRLTIAPERCLYGVTKAREPDAPQFAYWGYLDRQNTLEANIEPGLPLGSGMFTSAKPVEDDSTPAKPCDAKPSIGLGGASIGYVPPPKSDQVPPERAPLRTVRIREQGMLATAMDIIA